MQFCNSFKKGLILFAAVVLVLSVIAQTASGAWLSGWDYRKEQTVTGSTAGAQTNYQMEMTVHKGSGTDSATDVYCGGNCKDDFGDIRWTISDGTTLMDYWIESVDSGNRAVFWIEIPSIPVYPGTVAVYMYYGKSDATSISNGDATFMFFDDFTGTTINTSKWTVVGPYHSQDDVLKTTGGPNAWDVSGIYSVNSFARPFVLEFKERVTALGSPYTASVFATRPDAGISIANAEDYIELYHSLSWPYTLSILQNYAWAYHQPSFWSLNTWYKCKTIVKSAGITAFVNDVQKYDGTDGTTSPLYIGNANYAGSHEWDNLTVRKFASPEPTWGAWRANTPPVADAGPDQTVYARIDGIAEVTLDGSNSNDPDGDELMYLWTWSIDGNDYEANGVNPTIELPVGIHTIQLIVNDGLADSLPDDVNIAVIAPVNGTLKITPRMINRKSNQPNILAFVKLPDNIGRSAIDTNELLVLYPGGIKSTRQWISPVGEGGSRLDGIFGFFDKAALMNAAPTDGDIELNVVGKLKSGQFFYGTDSIWIIKPPMHRDGL